MGAVASREGVPLPLAEASFRNFNKVSDKFMLVIAPASRRLQRFG